MASSPTAWQARARAWTNRAAPERITLDFDATLVTSHSEKEGGGQFKRGFGFHRLVCYSDERRGACRHPVPEQRRADLIAVLYLPGGGAAA